METSMTNATRTGASREIHFRDRRAPEEIQFHFERLLMILLQPEEGWPLLTFTGSYNWGLITFAFRLRFEAALAVDNAYTLTADASWPSVSDSENASRKKSAESWFDVWTSAFQPTGPVILGDGSAARYQAFAEHARRAEAHLTDVPAIQQAILTALRNGATYSTNHKEGGTDIKFERGQFVRADYGDNPGGQRFRDETDFLAFLRKFYDWEISHNAAPAKVSEYDAWKLMLRLLRATPGRPSPAVPSTGGIFSWLSGKK
jgi:hypothetical protein